MLTIEALITLIAFILLVAALCVCSYALGRIQQTIRQLKETLKAIGRPK